jgi:type IV pilus assembly protein PilA
VQRNKQRTAKRVQCGFTLIEMLVVVLVIAILMAVAMPLYLGAVTDAGRKACRANMQTIASAEQAHRLRSSSFSYTTDLDQLNASMGSTITPVCPYNGTYSVEISDGSLQADNGQVVPAGSLVIRCSHPAHGSFAPGIDGE